MNRLDIAIVTLHGYNNYGNKLQNYALSTYLKGLNYNVETIDFKVIDLPKQKGNFKRRILALFNPKKVINVLANKIKSNSKIYNQINSDRVKKFVKWSQMYLNESIRQMNLEDLNNLNEEFDFFVVGSDQVWNPSYINHTNYYKYFLIFADKQKSISYAASFGASEIDIKNFNKYRIWLSNFEHLSVREEDGKTIIKKLLGQEVPVHVDPTLLLTKDQWSNIASSHYQKPENDYLLTYFLGREKNKNLKHIKSFAKENNLHLIHLNDIKDKERYIIDPSEFIDYFKDAKFIFTDSFHGAVFSIIFEKPFVVFNRGNMNSRIDTLLSKFNLENRHWDYVSKHINYFDIDFSNVNEILEFERKRSKEYLTKALNIE